jgi:hypothetical protein
VYGTSPGTSSFVGILNASRARSWVNDGPPKTVTRAEHRRDGFVCCSPGGRSLRSLSPHLTNKLPYPLHPPPLPSPLLSRSVHFSSSVFAFNSSFHSATPHSISVVIVPHLHCATLHSVSISGAPLRRRNQRGHCNQVTQINQPNQPTVGLTRTESERVRLLFLRASTLTRAGSTRAPCGTDACEGLCDHQRPRVRHQVACRALYTHRLVSLCGNDSCREVLDTHQLLVRTRYVTRYVTTYMSCHHYVHIKEEGSYRGASQG